VGGGVLVGGGGGTKEIKVTVYGMDFIYLYETELEKLLPLL
jgi:hypothetical protein